MRIINIRVDESMFNKMERHKDSVQMRWDEYIVWLFTEVKEMSK